MNGDKNSTEKCVICLDEKRSPERIQCGHSFCYGCLDVYRSYRKYPWANKCPICRDVLKQTKTTHWLIYVLLLILVIFIITEQIMCKSFML